MNNPLALGSRPGLAPCMTTHATNLPPGRRTVMLFHDGTVVCLGHEQNGHVQRKVASVQRRLGKRGIELTELAFSDDGHAWALVGLVPPPGCRKWSLEEELNRLIAAS
jgi:hypothetical protein